MKRFPLILPAVLLAVLGLCLLTGCNESSAEESSGGGLAEVVSITAEQTTATTARRTTAATTETTTVTETDPEATATTTTTEPTVVGKWALDSVVELGKVLYKDTSVKPAVSYRMSLQLEFFKNGDVTRIHPLYGYSEYGTWYFTDDAHTRVLAEFPYNMQFNPEELPSEYCFEGGNLFVRSAPDVPALNFVRVASFAKPDDQRVEDGKAALSVAGCWSGAWVTTKDETLTDTFDGKTIAGMKMQIMLGGDCTYYEENNPRAVAVYSLQNLGGGVIDLVLKQTTNQNSTIGQIEGNIYEKNGYLIWKYSDEVVIAFRSVTEVEFNKALFEEG
jgi:hypothetical protein